MLDSDKVVQLRQEHRNRQVRWGFIWAVWCAVLWGAWYVPGTVIYSEAPFVDLAGSTADYLLAAMVITTLNAVAVLLAMFLWVAVLGKTGEYVRTMRRVRLAGWYAPARPRAMRAVFGSILPT